MLLTTLKTATQFCTLILAYDDFELNETDKGKKSLGIALGALNSIEPVLLVESTNGKFQTN